MPFLRSPWEQRLQEVLNSNEEVSSISELAGQMGYGVCTIWFHYSDLCKQISARYLPSSESSMKSEWQEFVHKFVR
jgi:hypothetical protein